jgi:hypothetical protein
MNPNAETDLRNAYVSIEDLEGLPRSRRRVRTNKNIKLTICLLQHKLADQITALLLQEPLILSIHSPLFNVLLSVRDIELATFSARYKTLTLVSYDPL